MKNYKIEDLKIHPNILEKNGYKKYLDNLKDKKTYIDSWGKTFYNDYGKSYIINFTFIDMSYYYNYSHESLIDANPFDWEIDLQFKAENEEINLTTKIKSTTKDINEIENFCKLLFERMYFSNYSYSSNEDENNHKEEINKNKIIERAIVLEKELKKTNKTINKIKV